MAPERDGARGAAGGAGAGRSCKGRKADGSACGAPSNLVDPRTGFCPSHDPENREKVREAARKGGEATARKRSAPGINPKGGKWRLESHEDAKRWLYLVMRAVLAGKITHHQARAATRAVEAWMRAHEEGAVTERLDDLEAALSEWRETGDPAPVLELVEGGRS